MGSSLPFGARIEGRYANADGQVIMSIRARDRIRTPADVLRIGEAAVRGERGAEVREVWARIYGHDMPVQGPALAISYREAPSTEVATEFMDPSILAIIFASGRPMPEA